MKLFFALSFFCCHFATTIVNCQNITNEEFEGDIIAEYDTISSVYDDNTVDGLIEQGVLQAKPETSARGATPQFMIWNVKMNVLDLFVITAYISPYYSQEHYALIKKSLRIMARKTGVLQFKFPKEKPTDGRPFLSYGRFTGGACASYVGFNTRALSPDGQPIYLDSYCMNMGTIQHETMHALGFWHEQARPDRDEYISIDWNNIRDGKESNFSKQSSKIDSLGAPYDYKSVMHYNAKAFTSNGSSTIKTPEGTEIGQRTGISPGDKLQIRLLYQCRSGPRSLGKFSTQKCDAKDCKCGKNWKGCGVGGEDDDDKCKGELICIENKCKKIKK